MFKCNQSHSMGLGYGVLVKRRYILKKFICTRWKEFLVVDMKTLNDLVYGETDRFPITLNSAVRCIRYWLKLTCMGEDRLPRKSYMMLYNLDARGKRNWVSNVRMQLFQYGLDLYGWLQVWEESMSLYALFAKDWLTVDGRIGKIIFKLVTDLVCTEVLTAFRIVPKRV